MPRLRNAFRSSFSSTRIRDNSIVTRGLLTPVLFFLRSAGELPGILRNGFKLHAAFGTLYDFSDDGIVGQRNLCGTLWAFSAVRHSDSPTGSRKQKKPARLGRRIH